MITSDENTINSQVNSQFFRKREIIVAMISVNCIYIIMRRTENI